jgi:hypothetical protein
MEYRNTFHIIWYNITIWYGNIAISLYFEIGQSEGRIHGPAFASPEGILASSTDYDALFRKYLHVVQEETELIPGDQDVDALYSTFRTPRKTATTRIERARFGNQFVN